MILSTALLFCCSTLSAANSQAAPPPSNAATVQDSAAVPADDSPKLDSQLTASATKPDTPLPKFNLAANNDAESSSLSIEPAPAPESLKGPVKPAISGSYETARQRKIWYGLMAASHGAAAFDAWTTRRAISGGYGTEGDPLQRPFANSAAIYATTQVVPALMDILGHRMMHSENPTLRKLWWVPQAASAGTSLGAGIHNYYVVH